MREKLPPEFVAALGAVHVYEQIDPETHPQRWGYDFVATMPLWEAELLETWGDA